MYKSFVLRHVTEPSRVLFASIEGTVIAVSLWFILTLALALSCSVMFCLISSLIIFISNQAVVAFMTYKDPYFLNVAMARLRCGKTKNLIPTRNNRYGD